MSEIEPPKASTTPHEGIENPERNIDIEAEEQGESDSSSDEDCGYKSDEEIIDLIE